MGKGVRQRSGTCLPRAWPDEAGAIGARAVAPRGHQAEGRARHPKKSRSVLREGVDVKFGFVAKHRGVWPAAWLRGALGVSRSGFQEWLTRPRSGRSRSDEVLSERSARASSPATKLMAP